ncbi:FbpB family small basic protein [Ornithinibacillus scapharcae]|uniref:FbpB family small basic protein n=1 Tax=Ornithinibacillus scapharcae TaxID=1147159 RepID=UPI000225B35F|nr:FbpB family small basic protein [Ornithinibacillus scapharcae]
MITISLKKRLTFDELVQLNRQQILEDKEILNRIEDNLERRARELLIEKRKEA